MKGAQGNFDWYEKKLRSFLIQALLKENETRKVPTADETDWSNQAVTLPKEVNVYQSQRWWYEGKTISAQWEMGMEGKCFPFFYDELPPRWCFLASSISSKIIPQMFFHNAQRHWWEDFRFSISISLLSLHFVLCSGFVFCIWKGETDRGYSW